MFCTECGAQVADETKFCPKCGASLPGGPSTGAGTPSAAAEVVQPEAVVTPEGAAAQEPEAKKGHPVRGAVIAAAIVILLAGAGVGAFLFWQSTKGVAIDEEHFPDEGFRNYVTVSFDADGDGKLSEAEVIAVNTVDLSGVIGVADITGIAEFTELQSFNLGANTVEEVDLSQNNTVTSVSTGTGSVADLKLPSGFDMQAGLDGAAGTKVEAGDVVIQAGEWTTDNGGRASSLQRYNGVLYAGKFRSPDNQIEIAGSTPFFGDTDRFLFSNNKVYWTSHYPGTNGSAPVSLYSANIDGSEKKTIVQDHSGGSYFYVIDDYVFYEVYTIRPRLYACVNTKTGERTDLSSNVSSFVGTCGKRLVVVLKNASKTDIWDQTLAFFDPITKEYTSIPASEGSKKGKEIASSNTGVLVAGLDGTNLYSPTGLSLWSGMPLTEHGSLGDQDYICLFMDNTSYYLVYEIDPYERDFAIEGVNLSTNEHTFAYFTASDVPTYNEPPQFGNYATILMKDGNSLIVSIKHRENDLTTDSFLYRVSLEDGASECLQRFPHFSI